MIRDLVAKRPTMDSIPTPSKDRTIAYTPRSSVAPKSSKSPAFTMSKDKRPKPPSTPRKEQFDEMGTGYIRSLQRFPDARAEELDLLAPYLTGSEVHILDYACGNGYLTQAVLNRQGGVRISGVDSSEIMLGAFRSRFASNLNVLAIPSTRFSDLPDSSFDLALSLGGFHHILDQTDCLSRIRRKLVPGSHMVFADFEDATPSQAYFDDFIDKHNPSGHIGFFISKSRAVNLARACALTLVSYIRRNVRWRFESKQALLEFICQHHGLKCTASAAEEYLGTTSMIQSSEPGWFLTHEYAVADFKA